jgi:hypothetical protein
MRIEDIDTTSYRQDQVLFFIRIKGKAHFFDRIYGRKAVERLFPGFADYRTFAEYPGIADHYIDFDTRTLAELHAGHYEVYNRCIHPELPSIIARCRGLRSIPFVEAKELVLLHTAFFVDFLRQHPYRLIVIHIIDNYVLDVAVRVARDAGVKVLALSEFFIQGYRRNTLYGEYRYAREPSLEESIQVRQYFSRREKSFWLKGVTALTCARLALYVQAAYAARYVLRYLIGYKLRGNRSYEYRFAHLFGSVSPGDLLVDRFFDDIAPAWLEARRDELVYLPLHVYPEANVDYWMADFRHADYYTGLYEALSYLRDRGKTVLVKEHPGFLYMREWRVYEMLKRFDNVKLVHPFSPAARQLDSLRHVMVWMGSAGVEALMDGRIVVSFLPNYYSEGFVPHYRQIDTARPLNDEEKERLVRHILAGIYPA